MITLTRTAISDKALKFYKHIVYSVEKFIRICPEDYKLIGLYVIDAIVRQSKQLYQEKDVYGPRFLKNIVQIFSVLSKCHNKDKPMIQRVLQLWLKAGVFSEDLVELLGEIVISDNQELVERARIISNNNFEDANSKRRIASAMSDECSFDQTSSVNQPISNSHHEVDQSSSDKHINTLKRLIEQTKALSTSQFVEGNEILMDKLTTILNELRNKAQEAIAAQTNSSRNLDIENIIDSDTLHQLQLMIMKLAAQVREDSSKNSSPAQSFNNNTNDDNNFEQSMPNRIMRPSTPSVEDGGLSSNMDNSGNLRNNLSSRSSISSPNSFNNNKTNFSPINSNLHAKKKYCILSTNNGNNRSEHTDVQPPPPPPPPYPPNSSPSLSRFKSAEIAQPPPLPIDPPIETLQQIRRRRARLNLPELRADHIGILSHTIFIGHLHKTLLEHRLQTLCEEIGEGIVVECNFIPPRGCAFITYESRLAAHKALLALDNACVDNRQVKVAWAPNKGIKENSRVCEKFWSLQDGVTWIPYDIVKDELSRDTFDALLNGNGEFDHDTIPYDHDLRSKRGGPIPDYPRQRNSDSSTQTRKRPNSSSSTDLDVKKIASTSVPPTPHQAPPPRSTHAQPIHPPLPMMVSLSVPPPPIVVGQPPPLTQGPQLLPVVSTSISQISNPMLLGGFHSAPPGHIPTNQPIFTNAPPPPLPQGTYPRYPRMYGP